MNSALIDEYDVVVVGSGAGGMVAAIRAHDLGLRTVVIEKSGYYGGTTATSGGSSWIPMNPATVDDSADKVVEYITGITGGDSPSEALRVFAETAIEMTRYLASVGVKNFGVTGYPDYYSTAPGAVLSRAMLPYDMDGAELDDEFFRMRDHHPSQIAFNRYAVNFQMSGILSNRLPGWRLTALKMLAKYWLDIPWRLKTGKDRRLTFGRALIGALRKAMSDRKIPLLLSTELVDLELEGGRVATVKTSRRGSLIRIVARNAVVLAAGGFDQNQEMRDANLPLPTRAGGSLTPKFANTGDAIRIGQKVGAAIEGMGQAWWCPSIRLPSRTDVNTDIPYALLFERGKPGSICVNRLGRRFINEAVSYDQFGQAMIAEEKKSGMGSPCWMIFDTSFRSKQQAGGLMPSWIMSDDSLPQDWWDNVVFRANSIGELARKIGLPEDHLEASVAANNRYASTGIDEEFHRGEAPYDQFLGEFGAKGNNCIGPIDQAPFYAMSIELGDLGTKGGLKVDSNAAVLDEAGRPIAGLYAVGNTTASLFCGTYPGAGATLGQAMTFAFVAANHIASRATNRPVAPHAVAAEEV